MGSSGKKKTTMAKMARENKLRERRLNKQAKKDARKQAAADGLSEPGAIAPAVVEGPAAGTAGEGPADGQREATTASLDAGPEPIDPRAKEVALTRLRESPDEELAVFADKLLDDARETGASEQELREAQRLHPGHGAG